jgi:glycosyltransferase involved in cell wall biosynthesis
MMKKMSIIMATLNSEKYISQAIKSVLNQDVEDLEIILVDGGSTDKTLEIANKIESTKIKIIQGKDSGIAEAWNKGMKIASGELIGMLNSDDFYDKGVIKKVINQIGGSDGPIIGYGDVTMIDQSGGVIRKVIGKNRNKIGLLNGFGFMHTSVIINRQAYERVGPFDQKIRVAIDTDWLLRCVTQKIKFEKIPNHVFMRQGGISDINKYTGMGEYADALVRNGYGQKHMVLFYFFRMLGHMYKLIKLK